MSAPWGDEALWAAFTTSTLPERMWTHESHLRIAFLHLGRYPIDEAHLLMRVGIIRLNASHGLVETAARGYHETMTRTWLAVVAAARRAGADRDADSLAFLAANPELLDRKLPLRFYARDTIMSLRARTVFVEPDLSPFP